MKKTDNVATFENILLVFFVLEKKVDFPRGLRVDHVHLLTARVFRQLVVGRDMEHLLVLVDELLDDGAELPGCRFIRSLAAGAVARIAASTDAPRADGRSASTLSSEAAPDYLADRAAIIAGGCAGVASPLGATRARRWWSQQPCTPTTLLLSASCAHGVSAWCMWIS